MAPKKAKETENPRMVSPSEVEEEQSDSSREEDDAHTNVPVPVSLPKRSTAKRSLEKGDEEDKKKRSKTEEEEKKTQKKQTLIPRLFSEEDELVLLQGVLDFASTKGDPFKDKDAFYGFVKERISFDASNVQVIAKVQKLKSKFVITVRKSIEKGKGGEEKIVFFKDFDQKAFDLWRKIWGNDGVLPPKSMKKKLGGNLNKEEPEKNVVSTPLSSGREIVSFLKAENVIPLALDESTVLACWNMSVDGRKKRAIEEKLKRIEAMQKELCLMRIKFVSDTADMLFKEDNASSSRKAPMLSQNEAAVDHANKKTCVVPKHNLRFSRSRRDEDSAANPIGEDSFAIGSWEEKEVISREGHMKLQTNVFLASIDQRSELAAGESACAALVVVIAAWFHNKGNIMPNKSQFDSLIRQGSLEWRNLCENETYMKQFPNKHFDLDTVLQAKIRSLTVITEKNFVGFFHPDGMINEERLEFLQKTMSFDSIWGEIMSFEESSANDGDDSPPCVYIVSWNDHFFVLKVEKEAYYIIDTLGERLYEGCDQAYILKFDDKTIIHKNLQTHGSVSEIVCRGKESCKEYMKSFLAAIPIRELQEDIKKGIASTKLVHLRLQIEFNYTNKRRNCGLKS